MIVHTSPYSSISVDPEKRLLTETWFKESVKLHEDEVKAEINLVLDYAKQYPINSIIVDSRDYPFRENDKLQFWINHIYMFKIIDLGISRYAFIVDSKVQSILDDFDGLDEDELLIEYFTDPKDALKWIEV